VEICRKSGFTAYTTVDFVGSAHDRPGSFDSLLLAHVLEHVNEKEGDALIARYLPYVKPGGTVMLICPQERGFASDSTHVRWVDFVALAAHGTKAELTSVRSLTFPLPRACGKLFIYNEFIHVFRTPLSPSPRSNTSIEEPS